jgi:hypothetical protein
MDLGWRAMGSHEDTTMEDRLARRAALPSELASQGVDEVRAGHVLEKNLDQEYARRLTRDFRVGIARGDPHRAQSGQ